MPQVEIVFDGFFSWLDPRQAAHMQDAPFNTWIIQPGDIIQGQPPAYITLQLARQMKSAALTEFIDSGLMGAFLGEIALDKTDHKTFKTFALSPHTILAKKQRRFFLSSFFLLFLVQIQTSCDISE